MKPSLNFRTPAFLLTGLLLAASMDAFAQTGDVVIASNTTWAAGTIQVNSLTVKNGATLTVGGGSTVTVAAGVTVTGNSSIVLAGANTTAQVGGSWQGAGVTIDAASIEVDAGSTINADGQGYVAGAGPGGAPVNSSAGGSYGGLGGDGYPNIASGPTYGSLTAPTDLGSGGSARIGGEVGGAGGGAIRLVVSGTLTNDGVISANGSSPVGPYTGGGSGGSVYVTAGSLIGSGSFTANGSSAEAGGGGGRIAVYYGANSNFTGFTTSTATGGTTGSVGGNGTAGFFDTSAPNSNLNVYQDFIIPAGSSVSYNAVTVAAGAALTIGGGAQLTVAGTFTVTGAVVAQSVNTTAQVNNNWHGAGVTIDAATLQVDATGSLSADGQGYVAGAGPGGAPTGTSAAGSYGGLGGNGYPNIAPGPTYGSVTAPTDLGSGGSDRVDPEVGGSGGGAIRLVVSGTLTNNGVISANGSAPSGPYAGGGAGGSLYVTTSVLTGTGSFAANGGPGGEAGGGGGRIALLYTTNSGFNLVQVTANGGSAGNAGAAGTVDLLAANGNLTVSDNLALPPNSNLTFTNITINNKGALTLGSGTTLAANAITVSGAGNLFIGGGSTLNVTAGVTVTGKSNLVLQGLNTTAQVSGAWQGAGATINAASIQVDSGSTINADGQGYVAGAGPGGAPVNSSAGGSYGGLGGDGYPNVAPGPIYGSLTAPTDLGSGGNARVSGEVGGAGGGAIRLVVSGTLTNDGVISANGSAPIGPYTGGGSGGSVYVTAGSLIGTGSFTANGSAGEAGAGGGRIAVYYGANSNFTGFTASTATGGTAAESPGANGTVGFFDTSAPNTNLAIYQDFTIPAGASVSYNAVTVENGATLTIGGGAQVMLAGTFTVTGTVVVQSVNPTAQVSGSWQGMGAAIYAAAVQVDAGGSLSMDGQGYVAGAGPGGAPVNSSAAGSYGGLGGDGYPDIAPGPTYGSSTAPTDLGSGGSARVSGEAGGAGGGAIRLVVSGTLTNDGVISANGSAPSGPYTGGGSGGSVYILTDGLAGSGTFTANGGPGGEAGGGGGRVAVYYGTNKGVTLSQLTAAGGQAGNPGSAGTVKLINLCEITNDTTPGLADVQLIFKQAMGTAPPLNDLNYDGVVNVVDVQILLNAALQLACSAH